MNKYLEMGLIKPMLLPLTEKLFTHQWMGTFLGKVDGRERRELGVVFHMLWPLTQGALTLTIQASWSSLKERMLQTRQCDQELLILKVFTLFTLLD